MIICLDKSPVKSNYLDVEFKRNMSSKKPTLFDVEGKEPPKVKAPTLQQYLKENPNAEYPIYSRVNVVWFPGQWDNYSLECESFRVSIGVNHPIYAVLEQRAVATFTDTESALLICVKDDEGTIGFSESTVFGKYKALGNVGYRFDPTDGAN